MAEEIFIVEHTAILGPPNTERVFKRGEAVTRGDFGRCDWMFPKLIERKALRSTIDLAEIQAGHRLRQQHAREDLGLGEDAGEPEIARAVASYRGAAAAQIEMAVKGQPLDRNTPPQPALTPETVTPAPAHRELTEPAVAVAEPEARRGPGRPRGS